jgi:hypothetical protein
MSNKEAFNIVLTYKEQVVDVVTSYTYLGVVFFGPSFDLIPLVEERLSKGYATLTTLKRWRFQLQFWDIPTKIHLFHALVASSLTFGHNVWSHVCGKQGGTILRGFLLLCSKNILMPRKLFYSLSFYHLVLTPFSI